MDNENEINITQNKMDLNLIKQKALDCVQKNMKISIGKKSYLVHCPGDIEQVGLCANTLFKYFPDVLKAHIDAHAARFIRHTKIGLVTDIAHKVWFLYLTTFSGTYIEEHVETVCTMVISLNKIRDADGLLPDMGMLINLVWIKAKSILHGEYVDKNALLMKFRERFYIESRGIFKSNVDSDEVDLAENLIYLIWNPHEAVQYCRLKNDIIWNNNTLDYAKLNVASIYNDVLVCDEREPLCLYSSILLMLK